MDLYAVRQKLNLGISLNAMNLKVTYYSRVSTLHEQQKSSLKNQIDHFDEMIKNNPNWTYIKGYVDDGISGTSAKKRDNFMRMIDDAKKKKFDLIITKEISRFSRNTLDSIKYTRDLLSYGVAVLFVNDNINTAMPDAELRLTIMASMAQDEIRRLSERVKFGMKRAIKNGHILGNDMFYGYKKNKETGNLMIVENEAEVVKRLFRMYAIDNLSANKIAHQFNSEKIPSACGKKWCTTTLLRMIRNMKYKGFYCARKSEIIDYMTKKVKYLKQDEWIVYEDKIKIPPIIEEKLWDRANNRLLKRNLKFGHDYKNNKIMYQRVSPLSAKIYCYEHNMVFRRRKQLKTSNDITWMCAEYLKNGKKKCNSPNIRESEIYYIFDDIINVLQIDLNKIITLLIHLYHENNIEKDYKTIILEKEKEKICLKKEKLLDLTIEGNLSNIEFKTRNNELNNNLDVIEKKINQLKKNKEKFDHIKKENNQLKNLLNQKVHAKYIKEKIIDLLLNKIIVSKIDNDRNNIKLEIFLNYSFNKNNKCFFTKNYEFKRGYNTTGTKRYIMKYQVIV